MYDNGFYIFVGRHRNSGRISSCRIYGPGELGQQAELFGDVIGETTDGKSLSSKEEAEEEMDIRFREELRALFP